MKTSVEISPTLFTEARRLAEREGRTLRALIEEGLRMVVADHRARRGHFRLRRVTFAGEGLSPGLDGSWEAVRGRVYEGRGG